MGLEDYRLQIDPAAQQRANAVQGVGNSLMNVSPYAGPAMPIIAGVGAATQLAGLGFSAYAAYKQGQREKEALREARARYEEEKRMAKEQFEYRKYLDQIARNMATGQYAQGLEDRAGATAERFAG
jgi:hypothetical protein